MLVVLKVQKYKQGYCGAKGQKNTEAILLCQPVSQFRTKSTGAASSHEISLLGHQVRSNIEEPAKPNLWPIISRGGKPNKRKYGRLNEGTANVGTVGSKYPRSPGFKSSRGEHGVALVVPHCYREALVLQ